MFDQLTRGDIQKMQDEIDHRKLVLRPQILEALKEAKAQGDLSENFEYYAAKRERNQNDSRIRYLERMIKTATVIEDTSAKDEVGLNNTVTVRFEDDGSEETFKLVTSVRVNTLNGVINKDSPLGVAVMGKKIGERVEVHVNEHVSYFVTITKIEKTTDESEEIRKF
ncbi:MAG: transcription elongation factor GreA [Lachnospiraceae bacterium]|nr:transcription elongation factor GreA [Lachnospiraceae bacterium]MBP5183922.1 transcription elongation factor GreA [Lachnospiraceae bacterium]